jgi:hypothetical protein
MYYGGTEFNQYLDVRPPDDKNISRWYEKFTDWQCGKKGILLDDQGHLMEMWIVLGRLS